MREGTRRVAIGKCPTRVLTFFKAPQKLPEEVIFRCALKGEWVKVSEDCLTQSEGGLEHM
jgi:hypothetical protein